ncbi:cysteine--tRNA ligase [Candidatus Nomurabacteria bacterium CG1_02_43_90]|uniref:Cysteine--tRNA ligase n=1 Tax=Candidatus Nomurabacteria bacterium CG1_02_43_90 TaxID=1805281 RepID=A0A1J4V7U2_9BACT|nr:MAG: cysteine--tRNA ligase [Candidatus Nomurabacteria bacterium CG1_02_43_90]
MDVTLFNTLTRSLEKLEPLNAGNIRMYHCGPTVYDYAHIGNLRAYISWDILRRTLEYSGLEVTQVMNFTDIDDKTIKRSHDEGVTLRKLTKKYEDIFLADLQHLNIKIPQYLPHATEHIGGMVAIVEKLLRDGYAYTTDDGVYFDISKSKGYGALAELDLEAGTQSRIANDEYDKKNARDFALWKFWTEEDGGNVFEASFGRGRPGWHIECSAMAISKLGETIDIHTGGIDLLFPHHTNEIAQSEAFTGKQFSKYWLHNEFVMVDGQKMSKSLGNIITLRTIMERGFSPLAYRYSILGTHYRAKANFTWEGLGGAQTALVRLGSHVGSSMGRINTDYQEKFGQIVAHDLDTPRALALAWEVAKDTSLSTADKTATLLEFDKVLGLGFTLQKEEAVPGEVLVLVRSREDARTNKNWVTSDELRNQINALGWEILDTDKGQEIKKK